jgi:hypothetical protein
MNVYAIWIDDDQILTNVHPIWWIALRLLIYDSPILISIGAKWVIGDAEVNCSTPSGVVWWFRIVIHGFHPRFRHGGHGIEKFNPPDILSVIGTGFIRGRELETKIRAKNRR